MGAPTPAAARGSRAPGAGGAVRRALSTLLLRPAGPPKRAASRRGLAEAPRLLGTGHRPHGHGGRKHAPLASSLSSPSLVRPDRGGGEPSFPVVGARDRGSGSGRERAGRAPGPPGNVGAPQPAPAHLCAGKWTREGQVEVGARENRGPSRRGPGRSRDARRAAFQPCRPLRVAAGSSFWVAGCGPLLPALPPGR